LVDQSAVTPFLDLPPGTIEAFGLVLVRTSALVLSVPILGAGSSFTGLRIGLIASVSFLLYAAIGEPLVGEVTPITFGLMALKEILVGLFLGFMVQGVFLAVRVAGEAIGHEMGFMVARQVDPETGVDTPLVGHMYETFFILGLFAVNGHHWILRSLGESFVRAPVGDFSVSEGLFPVVLDMFGDMFRAGLAFAAPVMVLLGLVSIGIGILCRAVPYLNVMEVGFSVRVLLALVGMFLFAPLLEPAMNGLHDSLLFWLDRALDALA